MRLGIDCAFAGTTADFNQAFAAGIEWVGEYFGGAGCYHVWTNADRAALIASKIPYRLPIWVPDQSFASDPIKEAEEALAVFRLLGFKQVLGFDVEVGSGYTLEWGQAFCDTVNKAGITLVMYHGGDKQPPVDCAEWLAFWTGNAPSLTKPRSAQQYRGNTNSYGMSVDFDVATDDFPLEGLPIVTIPKEGTDLFTVNLPKGRLAAPIMAACETSTRQGGWLVGADGGVFCWGDAHFYGSAAHIDLVGPIVAILPAANNLGYTLIGSDGGTFVFGNGPKVPSLAP